MSLSYILKRVESSSGVSSPDLNEEQVELLKDFINQAASEIYKSRDLPVVLKEVSIRASNLARLSLPPFVGEIRGVRSCRFNNLWSLNDIRPRYSQNDWSTKVDKIRIIGESALANEILESSPVTVQYPVIDGDLTISIKGETSNSNSATDNIVMTAISGTGTKQYIDINSIKKSKLTDYNTTILDADGNELAIVYADQLESRYLIVDVSDYLKLQDCADGTFGMEVLYKPRLNKLINGEDEFPLQGYDDIIVLKTKQLLAEEEVGQENRAILMNQKSKMLIDEMTQDKTGTTVKKLHVADNKLLGLRRYWGGYWPDYNNSNSNSNIR